MRTRLSGGVEGRAGDCSPIPIVVRKGGVKQLFCVPRLLGLGELIEDGAVLEHGGAEILCAGFKLTGPDGDGVRLAIVFHEEGVGDGEVVGALLEAGLGIATRFKDCGDQVVGLGDGGLG